MKLWRLPIQIILWALYLPLKGVTAFLGLFTIAYMHRWRFTPFNDVPKWTTPWLNPEDWQGMVHHFAYSLPKWWAESYGLNFKSFYRYHAIRNPANGLRNIEWLDLDIVPEKVQFRRSSVYIGKYEPRPLREAGRGLTTAWYFAWQGFQAGFKLVHIWNDERHLVIKIGWRVAPADSEDRDIAPVLTADASFASKILPYRKG